MARPRFNPDEILVQLVATAVECGAEWLEIEYEDGREQVYAGRGCTGVGIAALDASGAEATALREQLHAARRRGKPIVVEGVSYRLSVTAYESFGETAYRVEIRRDAGTRPTASRGRKPSRPTRRTR
ncbi:MAG: hypothetical protein A3K19_29040 [Lentisphaerae bacterium RIFOXYB12_FULL_65_16]|nr:MAG: hypothetical protein A3K18_25625 [Lentisphaerae bacterium RIFOXYA12_64_32]OGV88337.1 MAG: hypothetical protein A3K19_29040 [Lentisphaerae bacterium RIFOXYB12_FULL_65_16]